MPYEDDYKIWLEEMLIESNPDWVCDGMYDMDFTHEWCGKHCGEDSNYVTPKCLHLYYHHIAKEDRKTENSSEKPNKSTISKMEQVDEPSGYNLSPVEGEQTETKTETQNSNLTFEKRTMRDCYNCKKYETEGECIECHYEPKDEPQTELVRVKYHCINCAENGSYKCSKCDGEMHYKYDKDEPQTNGYQTFSGTSVYVSRLEDEPQTDNGIGCSRCEGRYDCCDRNMPHAIHCNNYGKITDEPQTDCAWK